MSSLAFLLISPLLKGLREKPKGPPRPGRWLENKGSPWPQKTWAASCSLSGCWGTLGEGSEDGALSPSQPQGSWGLAGEAAQPPLSLSSAQCLPLGSDPPSPVSISSAHPDPSDASPILILRPCVSSLCCSPGTTSFLPSAHPTEPRVPRRPFLRTLQAPLMPASPLLRTVLCLALT